MARYRLLALGVHDTQAPAHDVTPANYVEWSAYQAWIAAGNVPDPMIVVDPFPTLASKRAEVLARLDGIRDRRRINGTIIAAGHTWKMTESFILAVLAHRSAIPPLGAATLPDINRVQVVVNPADMNDLATAIASRMVAVGVNYAALVIAINASATPFAIDLNAGWPT
jgi:hypothetical protein